MIYKVLPVLGISSPVLKFLKKKCERLERAGLCLIYSPGKNMVGESECLSVVQCLKSTVSAVCSTTSNDGNKKSLMGNTA